MNVQGSLFFTSFSATSNVEKTILPYLLDVVRTFFLLFVNVCLVAIYEKKTIYSRDHGMNNAGDIKIKILKYQLKVISAIF